MHADSRSDPEPVSDGLILVLGVLLACPIGGILCMLGRRRQNARSAVVAGGAWRNRVRRLGV